MEIAKKRNSNSSSSSSSILSSSIEALNWSDIDDELNDNQQEEEDDNDADDNQTTDEIVTSTTTTIDCDAELIDDDCAITDISAILTPTPPTIMTNTMATDLSSSTSPASSNAQVLDDGPIWTSNPSLYHYKFQSNPMINKKLTTLMLLTFTLAIGIGIGNLIAYVEYEHEKLVIMNSSNNNQYMIHDGYGCICDSHNNQNNQNQNDNENDTHEDKHGHHVVNKYHYYYHWLKNNGKEWKDMVLKAHPIQVQQELTVGHAEILPKITLRDEYDKKQQQEDSLINSNGVYMDSIYKDYNYGFNFVKELTDGDKEEEEEIKFRKPRSALNTNTNNNNENQNYCTKQDQKSNIDDNNQYCVKQDGNNNEKKFNSKASNAKDDEPQQVQVKMNQPAAEQITQKVKGDISKNYDATINNDLDDNNDNDDWKFRKVNDLGKDYGQQYKKVKDLDNGVDGKLSKKQQDSRNNENYGRKKRKDEDQEKKQKRKEKDEQRQQKKKNQKKLKRQSAIDIDDIQLEENTGTAGNNYPKVNWKYRKDKIPFKTPAEKEQATNYKRYKNKNRNNYEDNWLLERSKQRDNNRRINKNKRTIIR